MKIVSFSSFPLLPFFLGIRPLLVIIYKVVSPETIYKQKAKADSAGYILYYTYIYFYVTIIIKEKDIFHVFFISFSHLVLSIPIPTSHSYSVFSPHLPTMSILCPLSSEKSQTL